MKEVKFVKPEDEKTEAEVTREIIIDFLKKGLSQKQIAGKLSEMEIKPSSLSSVEKYIKAVREEYGASTLFHLACLMIKIGDLNIDDL